MLYPTEIRPFVATDLKDCMEIFRANQPQFFAPHEAEEFRKDLESGIEYFVFMRHHKIVGCGGVIKNEERKIGALCWGMVHPSHHRQGYGKALALYRINTLKADSRIKEIRLDTSQKTRHFYARMGFVVTSIKRDGYAPGLDQVDMVLKVD